MSRALSSLYDLELRPIGVQASQLAVLAVIAAHGPVRRSDIGRWLQFDSSTLTRTLRVMLVHGWIEEVADGSDGRGLPLRIATAGTELLGMLGPAWERAQARAARLLGEDGQAAVRLLFDRLLAAGAP